MNSKTGTAATNNLLDTAFLSLGTMLEEMGQIDFADKVYSFASSINEKCTPAIANKLMILLFQGPDDKALLEMHKACAKAPKDQYVLRTRGFLHLIRGEFDKAYKDYRKALDENSQWDATTVLMAYPMLLKQDPAEAATMLTDAVENNKVVNKNWPYPVVQCLRGDISMTDLLPQASTHAKLLEARAHYGWIKANSDDSQAGKADCLYVFNEKSGTAHVRLMASRGLKVIQHGYADRMESAREKADRIQDMDFLG